MIINLMFQNLQIVIFQSISLLTPMFLSSLMLSISNPGFTFGYECNAKLSCFQSGMIIVCDLVFFFLHPLIMKLRLTALKKYQEGIKKSMDMQLTKKHNQNSATLLKLQEQFNNYKKFELNFETMAQMTFSLILYLYSISSTRTFHSLLSVFDTAIIWKSDRMTTSFYNPTFMIANETCYGMHFDETGNFHLDFLKCIPTDVVVILNFVFSIALFTRFVFHT